MTEKKGETLKVIQPARKQQIPEADKPAPPVPIRNDSLKEAMVQLQKEPTMEQNVIVLNEVVNAKLLAPVSMDREPELDKKTGELVIDKDTEIRFEMISNNKKELYYPVFTDGAEMRKMQLEKDQRILIVSFEDLAAMISAQKDYVAGFVIDPKGANMVFPTPMVIKMKEEMAKEREEKEKRQ